MYIFKRISIEWWRNQATGKSTNLLRVTQVEQGRLIPQDNQHVISDRKQNKGRLFFFSHGPLDYQCPIPWSVSVIASECQLNFYQSPCRNLILRISLLTGVSFSVAGISIQQHLQYVRIMNLHVWIFSKNAK